MRIKMNHADDRDQREEPCSAQRQNAHVGNRDEDTRLMVTLDAKGVEFAAKLTCKDPGANAPEGRPLVVIEIENGVVKDAVADRDFEAIIVHRDSHTGETETWFDCGRVDPARVAQVIAEGSKE